MAVLENTMRTDHARECVSRRDETSKLALPLPNRRTNLAAVQRSHPNSGVAIHSCGCTDDPADVVWLTNTLWKDADRDIPIFIAAKAEYAKLQ